MYDFKHGNHSSQNLEEQLTDMENQIDTEDMAIQESEFKETFGNYIYFNLFKHVIEVYMRPTFPNGWPSLGWVSI